jgi:hypothetical protein
MIMGEISIFNCQIRITVRNYTVVKFFLMARYLGYVYPRLLS